MTGLTPKKRNYENVIQSLKALNSYIQSLLFIMKSEIQITICQGDQL